MKKIFAIMLEILFLSCVSHGAIKLLHAFAGGANDGYEPLGSLILSGTTLYGMTSMGGDSYNGTIFKIETNGDGFTLLHEFAGGANDGGQPYGSLILSGSTLYGMTRYGGDSYDGTIFKIETNGDNFTLLHEFAGGANDGYEPLGSLILSGTTLYGMTSMGGDSYDGTIFKIETNGDNFTLLHEFAGGANDGSNPYGSLLLSGSTLYGMTRYGGDSDIGTIFKIETNGTFSLLHEFAGVDGSEPLGSLILSGSTLYGMTLLGGDSGNGTIFKIETSGTGFSLLHSFVGWPNDGSEPFDSLILSDSTLYGMTCLGGYSEGTIFKIETNGTSFSLLHKFRNNEGYNPYGSLIFSGNTLYGMTEYGGDSGDGTIFSFPVIAASDFNNDNVTDLVWRHYATDGSNNVWLMSQATAGAGYGAGTGDTLAGLEYKEDGKEENNESAIDEIAVWADEPSAQQDFMLPEGEGLSTESPLSGFTSPFGAISIMTNVSLPALADNAWKICGSGDFNGDAFQDILWRYYGTGGSNAVWLMDGTNKLSSVPLLAQADLNWEIVGAGDFNNDQKVDILWRNKSNGKNKIWLMNGLARSSVVSLPAQANLTWKIVGCGDFNGDGQIDILWRFQGTGGKNQVWLMNGTARQSIVKIKAETNTKWQIAGCGDFDKNGKPDIIWRNYATGGANRIWIMNNTAYVRTETLPAVADLAWKIEN